MSTSQVLSEQPKHLMVADELRRRIQSGEWKPGQRLPSYSESRELFGVHTVTLEKAHAELEREGLIVRERRRGIFVAPPKKSSRKIETGLIGVSGLGFSFREYSPYWVKLLGGIREVCDEAEMQIVLLDYKSNKGWEKADGVLVCHWSNRYTDSFLPPLMPCVSLLFPAHEVVSVYADDYGGARMATEYLLKLGHSKIAYLHSGDTGVVARRSAGWRDALKQAGILAATSWEKEMTGHLDFGARYVERGRETMRGWLQTDWQKTGCTAVLAHNDEAAIGVIEALKEKKLRVPQDVSVIGFDGAMTNEYSAPNLTTVEVPLHKIGQAAARLLLRQLNSEEIEDIHRIFPVALREGGSASHVKPVEDNRF